MVQPIEGPRATIHNGAVATDRRKRRAFAGASSETADDDAAGAI
jgi:hypothetical protein